MDGLGVALFLWSLPLTAVYLFILVTLFTFAFNSQRCRHILLWVGAPQIALMTLLIIGTYWLDSTDIRFDLAAFSPTAMLAALIIAIFSGRRLGHPFHLWVLCHAVFVAILGYVLSIV